MFEFNILESYFENDLVENDINYLDYSPSKEKAYSDIDINSIFNENKDNNIISDVDINMEKIYINEPKENKDIENNDLKHIILNEKKEIQKENAKSKRDSSKTDYKSKNISIESITKKEINIEIESAENIPIEVNQTFKNKQKQIFCVRKTKKINKKLGRMKATQKVIYEGIHDKYSLDNLIRKIKKSFIKNTYNYINFLYSKFKGEDSARLIQRITPKKTNEIKKVENLEWFNSKLRQIFSAEISEKCSNFKSNYNKTQIDKLFQENKATEIIIILEKTIRNIYDVYRYNGNLEGFKTLKDDLKILKENGEDEEYLNKYRLIAQNLEQIFKGKKSRRKK